MRREPDLCAVDLRRIAALMGMTVRSLRRRLSEENANFTHILQEARIHVAQVELLRPGSCIKEVGERLGYSETTAFHRAFKRSTGMTPRAYIRTMSEQTRIAS